MGSPDKKHKKIFFKNLDGLRFMCFLSVFLYHGIHAESSSVTGLKAYDFIKYEIFGNGGLGVNFFFVLSGFLITYLLIEEKRLNGKIDVPKFWVRRILRIWPLYFFCVFFGFIIFPYIKTMFGQVPNESADPLYYVFFINNFDLINKGLPDSSVLSILWSIAVEEQFYLLWPLIMMLFPARFMWIPLSGIIIFSLVFRAIYDNRMIHDIHTFSCIGDMTIGAFGAWAVQQYSWDQKITGWSRWIIISIYIILVTLFLFRDELFFWNYYLRIIERAVIALVMLLVILEQNYATNSFFKMANYKWLSSLGIISYGLYCLHSIGLLIGRKGVHLILDKELLWVEILFVPILALIITITISKVSFVVLEKPFLQLKKRFGYISK